MGSDFNRRHGGVRRVQEHSPPPALEPLQGSFVVDESYDSFTVPCNLGRADQDKVAIINVIVDHRSSADSKNEVPRVRLEHPGWNLDGLTRLDGFDRLTRGNAPEERDCDRLGHRGDGSESTPFPSSRLDATVPN